MFNKSAHKEAQKPGTPDSVAEGSVSRREFLRYALNLGAVSSVVVATVLNPEARKQVLKFLYPAIFRGGDTNHTTGQVISAPEGGTTGTNQPAEVRVNLEPARPATYQPLEMFRPSDSNVRFASIYDPRAQYSPFGVHAEYGELFVREMARRNVTATRVEIEVLPPGLQDALFGNNSIIQEDGSAVVYLVPPDLGQSNQVEKDARETGVQLSRFAEASILTMSEPPQRRGGEFTRLYNNPIFPSPVFRFVRVQTPYNNRDD